MKTIAALTMFGVLALASAGTSGARGELGPTPGQPDPARVVLRSSDLGGARVTEQGYYRDEGLLSYSRTFAMGRAGGAVLALVESDAGVARSSSEAHDNVAAFRRYVSTAAGRAALRRAFQSADSSGLLISKVRVGPIRPISGTSGWDVDVHLRLLDLPAEAHIAMFTANRFLGELLLMGTPGRGVPHATVVRLAQIGWEICDAQGLNCNAVSGNAQSWRLTPADVGSRLVVVVTATNAAGSTTVASQPTAVISAA